MLLHLKARENNTTFNNMFLLQTHFITSVECLKILSKWKMEYHESFKIRPERWITQEIGVNFKVSEVN